MSDKKEFLWSEHDEHIKAKSETLSMPALRPFFQSWNEDCSPCGNTIMFHHKDRLVIIHDSAEGCDLFIEQSAVIDASGERFDSSAYQICANYRTKQPELFFAEDLVPATAPGKHYYVFAHDKVLLRGLFGGEKIYPKDISSSKNLSFRFYVELNAIDYLDANVCRPLQFWHIHFALSNDVKASLFRIEERSRGKLSFYNVLRFTPAEILDALLTILENEGIDPYEVPIINLDRTRENRREKREQAKKRKELRDNAQMLHGVNFDELGCDQIGGNEAIHYIAIETGVSSSEYQDIADSLLRRSLSEQLHYGARRTQVGQFHGDLSKRESANVGRIPVTVQSFADYKVNGSQYEKDYAEQVKREAEKRRLLELERRQPEAPKLPRREVEPLDNDNLRPIYLISDAMWVPWPYQVTFTSDAWALKKIFSPGREIRINASAGLIHFLYPISACGIWKVGIFKLLNETQNKTTIYAPYKLSTDWIISQELLENPTYNSLPERNDMAKRYVVPLTDGEFYKSGCIELVQGMVNSAIGPNAVPDPLFLYAEIAIPLTALVSRSGRKIGKYEYGKWFHDTILKNNIDTFKTAKRGLSRLGDTLVYNGRVKLGVPDANMTKDMFYAVGTARTMEQIMVDHDLGKDKENLGTTDAERMTMLMFAQRFAGTRERSYLKAYNFLFK